MLIDVAQLFAQLENPEWIVFDCRHDLQHPGRGEALYRQGHIPGAYFAPVDEVLSGEKNGSNGRHPLPSPTAFARFLEDHGVSDDTQIIAYDDVGGQYAARLWWMAGWIGLRQVAVIDGGLPKWIAAGYPLTAEPEKPRSRGAISVACDSTKWVSVARVEEASRSEAALIVDARAPERFRGDTEPLDRVAGHIPSARNRFFRSNLNDDFTMRPAEALRREFEELLQGRPASEVIHQCGSGITACANLLAMEHAGLPGSKLYPGSWSEWCADPRRPVATGF